MLKEFDLTTIYKQKFYYIGMNLVNKFIYKKKRNKDKLLHYEITSFTLNEKWCVFIIQIILI